MTTPDTPPVAPVAPDFETAIQALAWSRPHAALLRTVALRWPDRQRALARYAVALDVVERAGEETLIYAEQRVSRSIELGHDDPEQYVVVDRGLRWFPHRSNVYDAPPIDQPCDQHGEFTRADVLRGWNGGRRRDWPSLEPTGWPLRMWVVEASAVLIPVLAPGEFVASASGGFCRGVQTPC